MIKRVSPIIILVASATTAAAQQPPPAPPAPPPLKSGTITCKMYDEAGKNFELAIQVGNWEKTDRGSRVKFRLSSPEKYALPSEAMGSLGHFYDYDKDARVSVDVRLNVGFSPRGTITIKRHRVMERYPKASEYFVGICDVNLSPEFKELPE